MFEHSLIDLEAKTQPRRRRWLSLPLAIGLHLVGLTAFAFASYWTVGSVPEPSLNVAFIDVALPPPPPAGGGGHPKPSVPERPQSKPTPTETPIVRQPTDVSDEPPVPTAPPVADTPPGPPTSEGPVGTTDKPGIGLGEGPGEGPGIGPGKGTGVEPGTGDSTGPVYLTPEMSRPLPLQPILPRYTEAARRAGVQGTVIVQAIIDEQGRATNVRVLRGLPMGLDRAAMEAIQQVTFAPAMMGGGRSRSIST